MFNKEYYRNYWLPRVLILGLLFIVFAAISDQQSNANRKFQKDTVTLTESNNSAILVTPLDFPDYKSSLVSTDSEHLKQKHHVYISELTTNQQAKIAYRIYSQKYNAFKSFTLNSILCYKYSANSYQDYLSNI